MARDTNGALSMEDSAGLQRSDTIGGIDVSPCTEAG